MAFVSDLMDRSKIAGAGEVTFARGAEEAAGADVVIVDLGAHADLVPTIRAAAPEARIVAYGRHTETAALEQALTDGANESLARSRFFADPASWIRRSGQTRGQG